MKSRKRLKKNKSKYDKRPKYTCRVKTRQGFITYGRLFPIRNLKKFTDFLDKKFGSDWFYFNVYNLDGQQINNYTKNNKP